jgi:hypothetical protein
VGRGPSPAARRLLAARAVAMPSGLSSCACARRVAAGKTDRRLCLRAWQVLEDRESFARFMRGMFVSETAGLGLVSCCASGLVRIQIMV